MVKAFPNKKKNEETQKAVSNSRESKSEDAIARACKEAETRSGHNDGVYDLTGEGHTVT
jgi:hypothetical protein